MSKVQTFIKLLKSDRRQLLIAVYNHIVHSGVLNWMSDDDFLKLTYKVRFGDKLDLINPMTFNQKLQWLKLNDRNERYIDLVDKVAVKDYVSKIIGREHIVNTLGVYNSFDDIEFARLPDRFVIKCNHDSGSIVVCKDKHTLDIKKVRKRINKGLKTDAYFWGREWPYKNVQRKILIEEYLDSGSSQELVDYKLMCFNGKVKCSFVCSERFSDSGLKVTFFDLDWNVLPFERHYPKSEIKIEKPSKYDEMISMAEKLSQGIPFVRVDFYEVKGKVYFGEMTFYPGSGWEEFIPNKWDKILGEWINL